MPMTIPEAIPEEADLEAPPLADSTPLADPSAGQSCGPLASTEEMHVDDQMEGVGPDVKKKGGRRRRP